ncbi:hypothetical protein TRFO_37791 [Tritrichomonas foetus]|uniref:SUN domain-containing protein n=1 Tax=Tritrichomonas foetus TaxID=1144522 RepID=A0A1J4JAB4_9EUKA|nr:hypothetical protein TRFO_37791 [Tritrichomonas foetus]|eukprot:OHS96088.1 hypothetical protein TRFO_37791 [Tritrichomonas foetus]
MIYLFSIISLLGINRAARNGIHALEKSVFKARTFLYNTKHYFSREAYLKETPQPQPPTRSTVDAVLIDTNTEKNDQNVLENNGAELIMENNLNESPEKQIHTNKNANIDENLEKSENKSNKNSLNQSEVNSINQTEVNSTNSQSNVEEMSQNESDVNSLPPVSSKFSRPFSYIKSTIAEIKSPIETKPDNIVKRFKSMFASFQNVNAGRNGDYWEIKGQNEVNFTFQFEPNLIGGIELRRTNRSCEIKSFQVLDTQRDFILLNTSLLEDEVQHFEFLTLIQTNLLKMRVIENRGDEMMTCLYNYTLLGIV